MGIQPSDIRLDGRVAVVTGGGAGIGRGIAAGLAAFGASVAIWEKDPETCASAADEIGALGIPTDVRESVEVDAALTHTTEQLGPVTILVNNAGGVFFSSLLETRENGWDALYRSNLRHVFLCTQRVARGMIQAGLPGSVISVTSIEGVRAAPGYAAYSAAKAGVINYTKTAALELAPHGIRVNALAPDITLTEGMRAVAPPGAEETFGSHRAHGPRRPRGRDGRRGGLPGLGPGQLHHRPDHPRRRRHRRRRGLVPPPPDRRLLPRPHQLSVTPTARFEPARTASNRTDARPTGGEPRSTTMDEITRKVVDGTAWREFCDLLADAGDSILAEGNPDDPLDRAEGYRMLTRLLRGVLESHMEYARPAHPQLICTCHETIKIVAENPDNHYLGAALDGRYDYRIWGTRGEAKWISFNLFSGAGFGGGGPGTGATLHEEQMHIEPDGTFEVIISQREHPGNWLRSEPETRSLALRQTFLDKRGQRHAELHIERHRVPTARRRTRSPPSTSTTPWSWPGST